MHNVIKIFKELQSTSSRKGKEAIIENNKNYIKFVSALSFLLDDFIVTGISKKKMAKKITNRESKLVIHSFDDLRTYLFKNNTGRDEDIYQVQKYIETLTDEEKEFVEGLVTKSLKIGVTAKTLNKIMPNSVREFAVMLAEPYSKNEKLMEKRKANCEEIILTTKLDGVRNIGIVEDNYVTFYSRQGQKVEGLVDIENEMKNFPDGVYDGELIAILEDTADNKEVFDNTIKRSKIKGTKKGLKFMCFDYISSVTDFYNGKDNTPCIKRKNRLKEIIEENNCSYIEYLEPLYIGDNYTVIPYIMKEQTSNGEEGIMINMAEAPYECKRTKSLIKVKQFTDADVLITDVIEGDGRNKGKLGAIEIEFEWEESKYRCNVGAGFSDVDRELYWNNKELLLGKIATIQYFEITKNDNGGYGMRFPVWLNRIRDDKTEISMN